MRKIILFLFAFFMVLPGVVQAKSFSIDKVQIKGWVQPNGDMLVNEVFTYTLDGSFSRLTRSFPEKHIGKVRDFEAYLIDASRPTVGEIDDSVLSQVEISREDATFASSIHAENETVSVLYVYIMHNAVSSYDTYSDLNVTYFESGASHEEDLNDVTITYVLPGAVGDDKVHGFMNDREGKVEEVYRNGITFYTPKSAASTVTGTRLFFPSDVMTDQRKLSDPIPLAEALQKERQLLDKQEARWAFIPLAIQLADGLRILLIALVIIIVLLRWPIFFPLGNADAVLRTDPTYLTFIDKNGKFSGKHFMAGLFSLAEKGVVGAGIADSAKRFHGIKGAPEQTLVFHLLQSNEQQKKSGQKLLQHEQYLITWLFRGRVGHRKFHLHDMAGTPMHEVSAKRLDIRSQKQFRKNHETWHEDVFQLMTDAGALSAKLPGILKVSILALLSLMMTIGYYADGMDGWGFVFVLIVVLLGFYVYFSNPKKRWPAVLFFIGLFFSGAQTADAALTDALLFSIIAGAVLFSVTPHAIVRSLTALYTKMSIMKFRVQMKKGIPYGLSQEDKDRWLARAYLLNKSKKRLPSLKGSLPDASPLAPLFALQVDPLYFAYSTWSTPSTGSRSDSAYSGTTSYGSDGGSSGGGDGGGAGAD